jgi:hypothetical protein
LLAAYPFFGPALHEPIVIWILFSIAGLLGIGSFVVIIIDWRADQKLPESAEHQEKSQMAPADWPRRPLALSVIFLSGAAVIILIGVICAIYEIALPPLLVWISALLLGAAGFMCMFIWALRSSKHNK